MSDKFNGSSEQKIMDGLPDSINYYKGKIPKPESVINNSLNMLDTTNVPLDSIQNDNVNTYGDNTLVGQGDSKNRQRVLVREMPGGMNMKANNSQSVDNENMFNYNNVNNGSYDNNVSSNNNSMWGFTDTAILLSIAVLIALVFLVSTAAIMYFGLK